MSHEIIAYTGEKLGHIISVLKFDKNDKKSIEIYKAFRCEDLFDKERICGKGVLRRFDKQEILRAAIWFIHRKKHTKEQDFLMAIMDSGVDEVKILFN